jgi:hypothetical protein
MFFKGNYLRVLTPKTVDGNRPMIGYDGRVVYREDMLPLSAKRAIESRNAQLPDHLKKKIEVVETFTPKAIVTTEPEAENAPVKKAGQRKKNENQ